MRIAGVQLADGRRVWAEAGETEVSAGDAVVVRIGESEIDGWVFVSPAQLILLSGTTEGVITKVREAGSEEVECGDLPGSEMPPLGSEVVTDDFTGTVAAIDAVERTVLVRADDGREERFPLEKISSVMGR